MFSLQLNKLCKHSQYCELNTFGTRLYLCYVYSEAYHKLYKIFVEILIENTECFVIGGVGIVMM